MKRGGRIYQKLANDYKSSKDDICDVIDIIRGRYVVKFGGELIDAFKRLDTDTHGDCTMLRMKNSFSAIASISNFNDFLTQKLKISSRFTSLQLFEICGLEINLIHESYKIQVSQYLGMIKVSYEDEFSAINLIAMVLFSSKLPSLVKL